MAEIQSKLVGKHRGVLSVKEDIPSKSALANEFRDILWSLLFEPVGQDNNTDKCGRCNKQGHSRLKWTPVVLYPKGDKEPVTVNLMHSNRRRGVMRAAGKIHTQDQIVCREHLEALLEQLAEGKTEMPNGQTRGSKRKRVRTRKKK